MSLLSLYHIPLIVKNFPGSRFVKTYKTSRLSFLCLLGPQLHQQKHKPINANSKHHRNTRVPPSIALVIEIQRAQIVSASPVLANPTIGTGIGIE